MTDREVLEERLDDLEGQFGAESTAVVIPVPDTATAGDTAWPDGVDREAITITREAPGVDAGEPLVYEEVAVPIHRPPEHRGGVVLMTHAEIASVYAAMPPDIREAERERRRERGKAIPEVLR